MAVYIFQQCGNPSNTVEFDINPAVYSVGDVLFSFTNGATCWEMTASTGTGPGSTPDFGPYADCATCNSDLNAWEFQSCCNPLVFEYFAIANSNVSTFASGSIIEHNGECWAFTGNFYEGTSGTVATVTPEDITGTDCLDCELTCPTPTPTPSVTPTPTTAVKTKNFYNCCDIGGIIYESLSDLEYNAGQTYYNGSGCFIATTDGPSSGQKVDDSGTFVPLNACTNGECPTCPSPTPTPSIAPTSTPTPTPTPTPDSDCGCWSVTIAQNDIDAATNNTDPSLNNKVFFPYTPCGVVTTEITGSTTSSGTTYYCLSDLYITPPSPYYYVSDGIVTASGGSFWTAGLTPCTTDGECLVEPSPTPTTTPSNSVTPTLTPTITSTTTPTLTPTPSITPTNFDDFPSPTPTISVTPSVTETPSVTPSFTPTPSTTPPTEVYSWLFIDCCSTEPEPLNLVQFNIIGSATAINLTPPNNTYLFDGFCYTAHSGPFPVGPYPVKTIGVIYTDCESCNGENPCPTPTPTPTPTESETPTPTPTESITPTPTVTPTLGASTTPTPSITPSESVTPTPSITPSESSTPTPTVTPTESLTPTPSITPSATPTLGASTTPTPSITPSESVTPTPSITPSESVIPTPSITPSESVTPTPSITPSVTSTLGVSPSTTPSITPSESVTPTPSSTLGVSPSTTPSITPSESVTPTPSSTLGVTPSTTPSITPSESVTPTPSTTPSITPSESVTPTPSITPSITPTRTLTPTPSSSNFSPCTNDTVTPKGVKISFNSGSDYTNCTVYTGLTSSNITGVTYCTGMGSGDICDLTGITATLMEMYVKIVCEGCCEQVFRVNLDECCENTPTSPTPTPSLNVSVTPTPTPSVSNTPQTSPSITPSSSVIPSITPTITPTISLGVSPQPTTSPTPSITPTPTRTPSITPTRTITPTPSTSTPTLYDYYVADNCCSPFETITIALVQGTTFNQDAGVEYNGNKYVITGSGSAPAVVFSATTIDDICNTASCPSTTPTVTPTITPTPTPSTSSFTCECNTYTITFNENCSEAITWTDCDTGLVMTEQGLYFGQGGSTFLSGTTITLCSCTIPTVGCPNVDITLLTSGCNPYYYYIVMEVSNCNTGSVFGETYVVRSTTPLSVGEFITSTITPAPVLCAWKVISSTTGPLYDGEVTSNCGTSLPVSCCC